MKLTMKTQSHFYFGGSGCVGVTQRQTGLCYWPLAACARLTASVLLCFSRHTASPANVEHMATAASSYPSNNSQ